MTRYYADGRPATCGSSKIRYDAGGRAHVLPAEEPVQTVPHVRRLMRELALCKAQTDDLGRQVAHLRTALQKVQAITKDDDRWTFMAQEVFNLCREGLA